MEIIFKNKSKSIYAYATKNLFWLWCGGGFREKSTDKFWFTFFHELGHIIMHSKKEIFVELAGNAISKTQDEIEADEYATNILNYRCDV